MSSGSDPEATAALYAGFHALARFGRFRLDRASGAVDWSEDVYDLFGYDPAEGPPSFAMALAAFPEQAQAQLRAGLAESWETGAEISIAAPIARRDGGRRDLLVRLRADPPKGDAPRLTLSGVLIDVTGAQAIDARVERERALLSTTLDHMDQGVLVVRPDMSVPVLSRRVTELLSLPAAFVDTRPSFPDILGYQRETGTIPPEMVSSSVNAYILELADLPETHVYERETVDGRTLEVRTSRLPDGGFVRTFTDQTARRRREAEATRAQAEYRLLFENSVIGIYRATPDGRPVRANPALVRMNGYASEAAMLAAVGADPGAEWSVDPRRPRDFMGRLFAEGLVTDYVSEIYRHRTRERLWISESAWVIRDAAGAIVAFEGTVVDITERKRAEDRIAHMARQDALTGLPNRLAYFESLEAALAAPGAARVAVMLLDLDRFKAVNDTLGHPAGDALLRALSGRIAALVGPGEMVARFGGDELALLAVGAGANEAAALTGRLLAALRHPVVVGGREIAAGASVGVALAPRDGADPTELIRAADIALYRAKDEGRDGVRFFAPAMDAAVRDRRGLERDLHAALDRGEFALAFQPVVRLATGRPVGYEALLRWTHPERGPVPPEVFGPVAEETRQIGRIGAWALREAAMAAAAWPPHLALWIGVSAQQLAEAGFEAALARVHAASGLPPARLVLEVTETALMADPPGLAPRLARLRASGLRVALGAFGAGNASLGHLRRLRLDVIKLDRSFVRDLADPQTEAIVGSVLDLGRRIGLDTVAEGVETEAQLDTLRRLGCAFVQGGLVGAPPAGAGIGSDTPPPA